MQNQDDDDQDQEQFQDYNNQQDYQQGDQYGEGEEQMDEDQQQSKMDPYQQQQQYDPQQQQRMYNPYQQSPDQQKQIEDKISEELEEKMKVLDEFAKGKSEEQTLNIRMHQLALAKILVFTHGKGQFKLVRAHTNIGEAYLNYKCYEQAIDHLTIALKKNGKLFAEEPDSKSFNSNILTLLGKCYLEIGSYEDSLELLKKAYETQTQIYGDESENSIQTLTLIANCQTKMKDYDAALESIIKVYGISEAKYGYKSEQTAFTFIETAKIHACQEDWEKAIEYQNRSIEMLIDISYDKPDYVADLYSTLASYLEKMSNSAEQINALTKVSQILNYIIYKVKTIYSDIYGQNDKRVIKIKRQISIILLRNEQHQDALTELYETEELETKVYGESSVQVAKTQKIIGKALDEKYIFLGTILILIQEYRDALTYLQKSLKIFEENGMKKNVSEVKQKIKMVKEMKEKGKQPTQQQSNKEKQNLYQYD